MADLSDDADLKAEIQKAVDDGNLAVSTAESVRKFRILDTEFNPGERLSDTVSEAQAKRDHEGFRDRGGRALYLTLVIHRTLCHTG